MKRPKASEPKVGCAFAMDGTGNFPAVLVLTQCLELAQSKGGVLSILFKHHWTSYKDKA
jgi:hypothetical protein